MKRYQLIGILAANLLYTVGMGGYFILFFDAATMDSAPSPILLLFLLLSSVGMVAFIVFLALTLVGLYQKNRETQPAEGRPRLSPSGQVVFSSLNLYFGNGFFSSVFALLAMTQALAAKGEPTEVDAKARLRKARNLNLVSVAILALMYLTIFGFMGSFMLQMFLSFD
jgi:hypothetical protein